MPQIWMTYDEVAGLLDWSVTEARERILKENLDRKLSRDGKKRAKLSLELTGIYIDRLKASEPALDPVVEELRQIHGLMERQAEPNRMRSGVFASVVGG
jgi:hypothetical protein